MVSSDFNVIHGHIYTVENSTTSDQKTSVVKYGFWWPQLQTCRLTCWQLSSSLCLVSQMCTNKSVGFRKRFSSRDANLYTFIHIRTNFYLKYASTNLSTKWHRNQGVHWVYYFRSDQYIRNILQNIYFLIMKHNFTQYTILRGEYGTCFLYIYCITYACIMYYLL